MFIFPAGQTSMFYQSSLMDSSREKKKKLNSAAEAKSKAESILVLAKLALQSNQIFRGKHTERRVICFFSFFLARENIVESRCESKVNFHFQEKQCLVEDDRCSVREESEMRKSPIPSR